MRPAHVAPTLLSLLLPALFALAFLCGETDDGVEITRSAPAAAHP